MNWATVLNFFSSNYFGKFRKKKNEPNWAVLESILDFSIRNKEYYRLALIDPSCHQTGAQRHSNQKDNDRLEFLGDSVIGAIVSKYLYLKYPDSLVGPMSEKKARIVSREIGDSIAKRIGIDKVLIKNKNNPLAKDALGNALEAIVGAIFLDKGFEQAERFVRQKMISIFEEINQENPDLGINFKNKLLEWGLKEKIEIDFRLVHHNPGPHCTFVSRVYVDGVALGEGKSSTKKGSEQVAAKHALAVRRKKSAPPSSTN